MTLARNHPQLWQHAEVRFQRCCCDGEVDRGVPIVGQHERLLLSVSHPAGREGNLGMADLHFWSMLRVTVQKGVPASLGGETGGSGRASEYQQSDCAVGDCKEPCKPCMRVMEVKRVRLDADCT